MCARYRFFALILIFVFGPPAALGQIDKLPAAEVTIVRPGVIGIKGIILPGVEQRFRDLLSPSINRVLIKSNGGATATSLQIAEWIEEYGLDVEVDGDCISSCANYIFVAGRNRVLPKLAILGFHGGHSDNPWNGCDEDRCTVDREYRGLLEREQKLYLRRGVSLNLIVISSWMVRGLSYRVADGPVRSGQYNFWVPSKEAAKALGLDGDQYIGVTHQDELEEAMRRTGFRAAKAVVTGFPIFMK